MSDIQTSRELDAWRNVAGNVVQVKVDVGIDGKPLLPPDTTTDPRPEPLEDHYVTVVGNEWVQIPVAKTIPTLESVRDDKLRELSAWKEWILEQPVEFESRLFDGGETARSRISQAIVMAIATEKVPPVWVDYNNQNFPIDTLSTLKALGVSLANEFLERFYQSSLLRETILSAQTMEALYNIEIPKIHIGHM